MRQDVVDDEPETHERVTILEDEPEEPEVTLLSPFAILENEVECTYCLASNPKGLFYCQMCRVRLPGEILEDAGWQQQDETLQEATEEQFTSQAKATKLCVN